MNQPTNQPTNSDLFVLPSLTYDVISFPLLSMSSVVLLWKYMRGRIGGVAQATDLKLCPITTVLATYTP